MAHEKTGQTRPRQKVTVFQQRGSGERKIAGVRQFASDIIVLEVVSIDDELDEILDDTSLYLPDELSCDLVLDFLQHRDLSLDLAERCAEQNIPIISSGKKLSSRWALTPPT
jgi:hypothetical protein